MRTLANGRARTGEVEQRQLQFLETGLFNITLGNSLCANAGYLKRVCKIFQTMVLHRQIKKQSIQLFVLCNRMH